MAPPGTLRAPDGTPGSAGHSRWRAARVGARCGQASCNAEAARPLLADSTTRVILDAWVRVLVGSQPRAVETWHLQAGAGCDAVTTIGPVTAYSRPLITSVSLAAP